MNRVLILGGAGFLGVNMAHFCAKRECEVHVVDSLDHLCETGKERLALLPKGVVFTQDTVAGISCNPALLKQYDAIFHCAGQSSHPNSMQRPLYDLEHNCRHTLMFLEAMRASGSNAPIVYAGSSTVIGQAVRELVDEAHQERPRDIYSAHKGVAEKYHLIYRRAYDVNTVPLRFTNLYGPYGKTKSDFGFVNYFIGQAIRGEPITIYGEGYQRRNLLYVEDACDAMWRAAKAAKILFDGPYFVAGGIHYNVAEVARYVARVFGGRVKSIPWPQERIRIEIGDIQIRSDKFALPSGWRPRYTLQEGLEKTKEVMGD